MEYEKMLDDVYKNIKPIENNKERFEVPEANVKIQGNTTIIVNFSQIALYVRRDPKHLEKFLEKTLAANGKKQGDLLILQGKINSKTINMRIKDYIDRYIYCKECKKPDTELIKKENYYFIHCLACGAKHSVPKI